MTDGEKPFKFQIDKQSDEQMVSSAKLFAKEVYKWTNDTLRIYRKWISYIDGEREKEIITHFDCDLSDFRLWLEERKKQEVSDGGTD